MSNSLHDITEDLRSVDMKINEVDKRTHSVASTASKISGQCDQLNTQQMAVSEAMAQMHGIFSESKTGVNEIRSGANDIVEKMLQVSELSAESSSNMKNLSNELSAFVTTDAELDTKEALADISSELSEISSESGAGEIVPSGSAVESSSGSSLSESVPIILEQNEVFANIDKMTISGDDTEKEEDKKTFTSEPDNDEDLLAYFNS
jgi:uncharacterized phage infection (PIP) family protein YhgE